MTIDTNSGVEDRTPHFWHTEKGKQSTGIALVSLGTILMIGAVISGVLLSRHPIANRTLAIKVGASLGASGVVITALGIYALKPKVSVPLDKNARFCKNLQSGMKWAEAIDEVQEASGDNDYAPNDAEAVCNALRERLEKADSLTHYLQGIMACEALDYLTNCEDARQLEEHIAALRTKLRGEIQLNGMHKALRIFTWNSTTECFKNYVVKLIKHKILDDREFYAGYQRDRLGYKVFNETYGTVCLMMFLMKKVFTWEELAPFLSNAKSVSPTKLPDNPDEHEMIDYTQA